MITPESVTSVVKQLENENIKEWTVVLTESESGTYTYSISGAYVNGYTGDNEPVEITVTVSDPEEPESTFFEKVIGFFKKIFDFFVQLLSYFGVELV